MPEPRRRGGASSRPSSNDFFGTSRDRDRPQRGDRDRNRGTGQGRNDVDEGVADIARSVANMQILTRNDRDRADSPQPKPETFLSSPRRTVPPVSGVEKRVSQKPQASSASTSVRPVTSPLATPLIDGVRLIGEHLDFFDQINDFLSDTNTNYTVISVAGPQGVGKSTLLSMIGGNDSLDMYRQYIFRPSSREAIESSRHQTSCVSVYVTKLRMILIDCQALNSGDILDDAIRLNKGVKLDERLDTTKQMEVLQVLAFILHVSHALILHVDWFLDFELIRTIRMAEMLRADIPQISTQGAFPLLNNTRKVSLLVVHARARCQDVRPSTRAERLEMLRAMFADSPRIKVVANDEFAYFCTPEIKLRRETGHGGSGATGVPAEMRAFERAVIEDFDESMRRLRPFLAGIRREEFAINDTLITERQWFRLAKLVWNDVAFNGAAARLATFL